MTTSGAPTGLRGVVEEVLSIGALSLAALAVLLLVRRLLPPPDPIEEAAEASTTAEALEAQVEGSTTLILPEDLLAWAVVPPPVAVTGAVKGTVREVPAPEVRTVPLPLIQPAFRPKVRLEDASLWLSDTRNGCRIRATLRVDNGRERPMRAALKVVRAGKGDAVLSHKVTLAPGARSLGLERDVAGPCPAPETLRATLTDVRAAR